MRALLVVFLILSLVVMTACADKDPSDSPGTVYLPSPEYPEGQLCFNLAKCQVNGNEKGHFVLNCDE